ncbi:MAG: 6-pyruvoyl tetrahydrobiopterin synthase [Rhodocyclaceae bacterium]|nr:MAG: 6-pyruvoyl tetrahydrobiopterin synthase [Rhodocyclaceae bacterium]
MLIDRLLELTEMANGEADVRLNSVIVHETETGYAQCFREDAINPRMGLIALDDIKFSEAIRNAWPDPELFDKLKRGERFANPLRV